MTTPTRESDFPDVDAVFEDAAGPPPVLDYRRARPAIRISDRSDAPDELKPLSDLWRFVRRLVFAGALAALFGGFGLSLNSRGDGALAMAWGAGILGLFLPIPGAEPNA